MTYEKARELAKQLQESEEFQSFQAAREVAFADETAANLLRAFRKLQLQAQAEMVAGNEPSPELQEQLKGLYEILQHSQDVMNYLMAEHAVNQIMSDIYKILADAVEIDLHFLED